MNAYIICYYVECQFKSCILKLFSKNDGITLSIQLAFYHFIPLFLSLIMFGIDVKATFVSNQSKYQAQIT